MSSVMEQDFCFGAHN